MRKIRVNDINHDISSRVQQRNYQISHALTYDFSENMQSHRDSKNYLKWNLEDTARLIQGNFLDSHLIVIRPARIEYKTFSCFKNFVPSNNCGAPEHTPMHYALQHLEKVLETVSEKLRTMTESELRAAAASYNPVHLHDETDTEENTIQTSDDLMPNNANIVYEKPKLEESFWWRENVQLDKYDISLIGFSKGCVVLNQFLYEFHYLKTLTPDDQTSMGIVSRIKDMYWLDGGHSGGKNTWITSRPLLETLTRLGIKVHVHVTPYQIQDDRRPWIKKEEKLFSDILRRLGAPVDRSVHFENVCPNLFIHFDVINVFKDREIEKKASQKNAVK
ncbi:C2orf69 [Popillia japonica]|uniref:C2orf69 n=1 Tax=Popillia japonica TaxID=7064 RepID=A0AAW1LW55_POPJA